MVKKKVAEVEVSSRNRIYEVGYHILPTVEGEKVDQVVQNVRNVVQDARGNLLAEGAPQDMKLAYTMYINNQGKNTAYERAYFGWIKFEMGSGSISAIEDALRAERNILRSIVFKTVREDTRAEIGSSLREVRRGGTLKTTKRTEESTEEVSEEKLDEAIEDITKEE